MESTESVSIDVRIDFKMDAARSGHTTLKVYLHSTFQRLTGRILRLIMLDGVHMRIEGTIPDDRLAFLCRAVQRLASAGESLVIKARDADGRRMEYKVTA